MKMAKLIVAAMAPMLSLAIFFGGLLMLTRTTADPLPETAQAVVQTQETETPEPTAQPNTVTAPVVTVVPSTAPAVPTAATEAPTGSTLVSEAQLQDQYLGACFSSIDAMPSDLRTYYLSWLIKASQQFDVPAEDIVAIHMAERWSHLYNTSCGIRPFEPQASSAGAVGVGQVTPGFWSGFACTQVVFFGDPATIASCNGNGVDLDGDGTANPLSMPDNIGATANALSRSGLSCALRQPGRLPEHADILYRAAGNYNAGPNWPQIPISVGYAQFARQWMVENWETVARAEQTLAPDSSC